MTPKMDPDEDEDDEKPRRTGRSSAQRIPQHKHCLICNKAIPAKDTLCSEECEEKYEQLDRKRRNYMYIMYGLFAVVIIMVMLSL